jgi:hypothetical protein
MLTEMPALRNRYFRLNIHITTNPTLMKLADESAQTMQALTNQACHSSDYQHQST